MGKVSDNIMFECLVCGKDIPCYKSTYGKKKYCSIECRKKTTNIDVKCIVCKKTYNIAKSRYNERFKRFKTCSDECYDNYKIDREKNLIKNIEHTCKNCNKIFKINSRNKARLYCSTECNAKCNMGENNLNYKNGKSKTVAGYIWLSEKKMYEHRYVIEEHIGRELKSNEIIHHLDGNKSNNTINNLIVMDKREHDRYHTTLRHKKRRGEI